MGFFVLASTQSASLTTSPRRHFWARTIHRSSILVLAAHTDYERIRSLLYAVMHVIEVDLIPVSTDHHLGDHNHRFGNHPHNAHHLPVAVLPVANRRIVRFPGRSISIKVRIIKISYVPDDNRIDIDHCLVAVAQAAAVAPFDVAQVLAVSFAEQCEESGHEDASVEPWPGTNT